MLIMFGEFGILLTLPLFLQNVLGFTAHPRRRHPRVHHGRRAHLDPALRPLSQHARRALRRAHRPRARGRRHDRPRLGVLVDRDPVDVRAVAAAVRHGRRIRTAQITNVILRDVPVEKSGQASGTQSTSRQLGVALGIAVLGAVLWISLGTLMTTNLQTEAGLSAQQSREISDQVVQSSGVTINSVDVPPQALIGAEYGDEVQTVAEESFAQATARATYVGAAFVAIGVLGTVVGMRRREDEQDQRRRRPAGARPRSSRAGRRIRFCRLSRPAGGAGPAVARPALR